MSTPRVWDRTVHSHPLRIVICFLIIGLIALAGPVAAAVITIDAGPANIINTTVRNAVAGDTIILNPGTYTENGILVNKDLTIRANTSHGGTAANTIIDGTNTSRIMYVNTGITLSIDNLTFTRGDAGAGDGGAIYNSGTMDISSSTFTSCAARFGGAIYNEGTMTISSSTFTSCSVTAAGGAIDNNGTVTITTSTFSFCGGRAIFNHATATISYSTFSSCPAGAIYNGFWMTISSSSFSSCSAGTGGAISNSETMIISSSTFSSCSATNGGAIYNTGLTSMTISTSTFSSCSASNRGGAIFSADNTMTITSSTFTSCSATNGGAIYQNSDDTNNVHFSRIYDCNTGTAIVRNGGTFSATNTWWGTNANPAGYTSGGVTTTPWLMLNATASPSSIASSQTSLIRANLTFDSAGTNTIASGHIPNGTTVTFTIVSGEGSLSAATNTTTLGAAETTFIPFGGGTTIISATVDDQTVYTSVTVAGPAFTGTPVIGTTPLAVTFTDASVSSPTMWNWSFGDGTWFNTTSAAASSPVHTYPSVGTYTVSLTATISGTPATLSRAGYITVTAPAPGQNPPASDPGDGSSSDSGPSSSSPPVSLMVNIGGNSAVDHAEVTGTGINNLIVTGMTEPGSNVPPPPGTVYQYIGLVPARFTTITEAAIIFTIPAAWLEENNIPPENIVLYHYENSAWVALPTTVTTMQNGIVTFTATSPGFSLFAIAGTPGTPETPGVKTFGDLAAGSGPAAEDLAGAQAPAVTQTTAVPAPDHGQAPEIPLPLLVIAGLVILAAGGFVARRWWIRRQNPALFRKYD